MAKRGSKLAKKAKKKGLSLTKMKNIQNNKLAKQGKLEKPKSDKKKKRRKKGSAKAMSYSQLVSYKYTEEERLQQMLADEPTGEDMMAMMEPEDLEYLKFLNKKRGQKREANSENTEVKQSDEENEEKLLTTYEEEGRTFDEDKAPPGKRMKTLLPFKTDTGIVVHRKIIVDEDKSDGEDSGVAEDESEEEKEEEKLEEKSAVDLLLERQRKLDEKKVKIGCLAANFIEDPQERLSGLSSLIHMLSETDPDIAITVKKYAALSLLEVFGHVLPAFRIFKHNLADKLKKETRKVYFYENYLVDGYKLYLLGLEAILNDCKKFRHQPAHQQLGIVAIRCLGSLLDRHASFNFATNIVHAIVPFLNHGNEQVRANVREIIMNAFKKDDVGVLSLEIVECIDRLVRKHGFKVDPGVVRVLLCLRICDLHSLDAQEQNSAAAKRQKTHSEKLIQKLKEKHRLKPSRQQTKDNRKMRRIEVEMEGCHTAEKNLRQNESQTRIIQLIFGLYVHVLKRRPNEALISAVLEGLARFAHLINVEFFSDLLNVLSGLVEESTNLGVLERLRCIQTVFTILSGQGAALAIDPHRFYIYLFSLLMTIAGESKDDVISSAIESLHQLLSEKSRRVGTARLLSFSKRLSTVSLSWPHHAALAALAVLRRIILTHTTVDALLETDDEGSSGFYDAHSQDPALSNASATALWELHVHSRHYHPTVRQFAINALKGSTLQGKSALPIILSKKSAGELFVDFNPHGVRFNPLVKDPPVFTTSIKRKTKEDSFLTAHIRNEVDQFGKQDNENEIDFFSILIK